MTPMTAALDASARDALGTMWSSRFSELPLIAILRGVEPEAAADVVEALVAEGFGLIEIPLNSPRPFDSIRAAAEVVGDRAVLGAGTVLSPDNVARTVEAGGRLIVAPNLDEAVAAAAAAAGVIYSPGVATATEMFRAYALGAQALKLFPGEMIGPPVVKALRAVAPADAKLIPVGGVTPERIEAYVAAGADGFGLGSALYKPGARVQDVREAARAFRDAYQTAVSG